MKKEQRIAGLGRNMAIALVLGNVIGSGIFLLPAALASYGGISLVGWIISSVGALSLAHVFTRLNKLFPKTGGPYVYARMGFGDFAGFLVAWGYWLSIWCTNAAIAVAMVSYLGVFLPILTIDSRLAIALGLGVVWFLTWANSRGIRKAGYIQLVTTIMKVIPLILVAVVGVFFIQVGHFKPFNLSGESDFMAIIQTTTLTLFAFLGVECATIPAEAVEGGPKTVAEATRKGTWITILIYIFGSLAVLGIVPPDVLRASNAPFSDAASAIFGPWAAYFVAAGAVISTFGALNGWILMQGQIPFAASRDGLLPRIFSRTNQQGTPYVGLVISSILISLLMVMNYTKGLNKAFEYMILLSTLCVLVPYLFSSAAALRSSYDGSYSSFRQGGFLIALVALVFSGIAVIGSGKEVILWGSLLLAAGIPFYLWMKLRPDPKMKK